ncbi:MAG: sensor histidine kinase [Bellilinea sp.]
MDAKEPFIESWNDFKLLAQSEYEHTRQSIHEIAMMLEQSKSEYAKLTQRSSDANTQIQQIQGHLDTIPREDLRDAYDNALDAQQRLLVMRNQIEKLQNDQASHTRYLKLLEKTQLLMEEGYQPDEKPGVVVERSAYLEQMIGAQEEERQRLSRQMHDGPAQALSNFIVQAEIAARLLEIDPVRAKQEITNLKDVALSTFQRVRLFIYELRPMMLDDLGLVATLKRYTETFKDETGLEASIDLKGTDRKLASYIEVFIFRAVQELMGNVVRNNAGLAVKPNIIVQMAIEDTFVRLTVSDNGKGFDPAELEKKPGMGLKQIKDRVEMLGGTMQIDSSIGQGARIFLHIPVEPGSGV